MDDSASRRHAGFARALAFPALVLLLGACGKRDDQGGTQSAERRALASGRLVEDLRLDATSYDLPKVSRVYVGRDGRMIVPIHEDKQLRVYDPSGKELKRVGRSGGGPGEFAWVLDVAWRADSFWVNDIVNRRVTTYDANYRAVRTESFEDLVSAGVNASRDGIAGIDPRFVFPLTVSGDGAILGHSWSREQNAATETAILVRYRTDGGLRVVDSLPQDQTERGLARVGGSAIAVPFLYRPQFFPSSNDGRVAIVDVDGQFGGEPRIRIRVVGGDGVRSMERTLAYTPHEISAEALDSAISAISKSKEGPSGELARQARTRLPKFYAPVDWLVFGLDDTIWLGLHAGGDGQPVLILNDRGVVLDSLTVPPHVRVRQTQRDAMWAIDTDDDGLASVVRYRVVPAIGRTGADSVRRP